MDIIITSKDGGQTNFVSNFISSINIADGFEIGVKSIHHGPLFNVTEGSSIFSLAKKKSNRLTYKYVNLYITPGFYENAEDILVAVYNSIRDETDLKSSITYGYSEQNNLELNFGDSGWLFCYGSSFNADLLHLLGYHNLNEKDYSPILRFGAYWVKNPVTQIGLLYSNIVTNMTIDQQRSRLIAVIPLSSNAGYNFKEFTNPMYRPLSVASFIDINFILTDLKGDIINFAYGYPTVIHLHIRKSMK